MMAVKNDLRSAAKAGGFVSSPQPAIQREACSLQWGLVALVGDLRLLVQQAGSSADQHRRTSRMYGGVGGNHFRLAGDEKIMRWEFCSYLMYIGVAVSRLKRPVRRLCIPNANWLNADRFRALHIRLFRIDNEKQFVSVENQLTGKLNCAMRKSAAM